MRCEPPGFKKSAFTCPHCTVYASFIGVTLMKQLLHLLLWEELSKEVNDLHIATCTHCKRRVIWFSDDSESYCLE